MPSLIFTNAPRARLTSAPLTPRRIRRGAWEVERVLDRLVADGAPARVRLRVALNARVSYASRLRVTFVEPAVSRCRDSLPSLCARRRHAVRGASAMDRGDDDVRRVHEFSNARRESTRCRRAARCASRVVCSRRSHANARLTRAGENKRERSDEHARAFVFDVGEDAVESPSFAERLSEGHQRQDAVRVLRRSGTSGSLLQRSSLSSIVLRLVSIALVRFIFRRAYRVLCACCSFLYAGPPTFREAGDRQRRRR